jgi:hypothetical protein
MKIKLRWTSSFSTGFNWFECKRGSKKLYMSMLRAGIIFISTILQNIKACEVVVNACEDVYQGIVCDLVTSILSLKLKIKFVSRY